MNVDQGKFEMKSNHHSKSIPTNDSLEAKIK